MRVAIIGNSGSGKSTLARQLATRFGAATLDLDTVAWEPGEVAVARPPADAVADVRSFCEVHDAWIVEGCYAALVEAVLPYAPSLLFLDPGVEVCLAHCQSRPWEPHKYPSKAAQDEKLAFLLDWVRAYYTRDDALSLAAHEALFHRYAGPKQRLAGRTDGEFVPPGPDATRGARPVTGRP